MRFEVVMDAVRAALKIKSIGAKVHSVKACADDTPIMPSGKYKGMRLDQLPDDYCRWLLDNCDLREGELKDWLEAYFGE